MNEEELLENIGIPQAIEKIHHAITEKFSVDHFEFDAWYTNRSSVFLRLGDIGQETAKAIRENRRIPWSKKLPEPLRQTLAAKNVEPKNWEDSPDGVLATLAIILVGWIANQAAQKSRDNPNDGSIKLFDKVLRPLILASMDKGMKIAGV